MQTDQPGAHLSPRDLQSLDPMQLTDLLLHRTQLLISAEGTRVTYSELMELKEEVDLIFKILKLKMKTPFIFY